MQFIRFGKGLYKYYFVALFVALLGAHWIWGGAEVDAVQPSANTDQKILPQAESLAQTNAENIESAQADLQVGTPIQKGIDVGQLQNLMQSPLPEERYRAVTILQKCVEVDILIGAINSSSADFEARNSRSAALKDVDNVRNLCSSLNPALIAERLSLLESLLADHFKADYAVGYYYAGPNGNWSDVSTRPDDPVVREWYSRAMTYLERGAASRSTEAMATLAAIYLEGPSYLRDPISGLAYEIAANKAAKKLSPSQRKAQEIYLEQALKSLGEVGAATARAKANEINEVCCRN